MPDEDMFTQHARLAIEPPPDPTPAPPETIAARFDAWIERNPQVLTNFVRLAREAKAAGRTRIGAKLICEVLRWDSLIAGDDDGFKLNNVYVAHLARLAVEQNPDLEGMFEMRHLRAS